MKSSPGPVEKYILDQISEFGSVCFALLDSENLDEEEAAEIANKCQSCNVTALLVGGSTAVDQLQLDRIVRKLKEVVTIPVILFPGNVTGISPHADAILFSCLLNSDNPYFITEAQALGAATIRKYGLEAIPMGYVVIGEGGTTGFIGRARGIPSQRPKLAAIYAMAAQYFGMRFVYLEAGSGVTSRVSQEMIKTVRESFEGTLLVGGGIRAPEEAEAAARSGADVIVIGTLLEHENFEPKLKGIVNAIRQGASIRPR